MTPSKEGEKFTQPSSGEAQGEVILKVRAVDTKLVRPRILRTETTEAWRMTSARFLARAIGRGLALRGTAGLVVPGGRTAAEILPVLAGMVPCWRRVRVVLADERWVPPWHPDSNEGQTRRLLPKEADVFGLWSEDMPPFEGCLRTARRLAGVFPVDVTFLGMGEDAHVASLFPGDRRLSCTVPPILCTRRDDHLRVSLSPALLLHAREVVLSVAGVEKLAALDAARLAGSPQRLPVRILLHQNKTPLTVIRLQPRPMISP